MPKTLYISSSYDASTSTFRLLRAFNWGPLLMNLGWFPFRGPLSPLNLALDLGRAQMALVAKSVALLRMRDGDTVLDVACGRGKSSYMIGQLYPQSDVVGVDLLPENIHVARTVFGNTEGLSYVVGDAMHLAVADRSFDRVHCLEAAFHFPDRRRFLREASRVLRDGGRAVVVDFAWKTAQGRSCRDEESTRLVRQIWQWDDLFSVDEYKQAAQEAGFDLERCLDWTRCVAAPLQLMFEIVAWLGLRGWGRRLLVSTNPLLRRMSTAEWQDLAASARAHHDSRRHTRYIALVLRKPPASGTTPGN